MPDDLAAKPLGDDYVPRSVGVPGPSQTREEPSETEADAKAASTPPTDELPKSKLAETLDALNNRITSSNESARLLADPDIRKLLQLKQSGKPFRIDDGYAQEVPSAALEQEPDLESMTNAQLVKYQTAQTVKALDSIVEKRVSARVAELEARVNPALQRAVSHAEADEARRIAADVDSVRKEFPDFDQVKPLMAQLNQTVQGVSARELYLLAKVRSGLPIVSQKQIETERPSAAPASRRAFKPPTDTRGRKGFNSLLDSALADVGSTNEE